MSETVIRGFIHFWYPLLQGKPGRSNCDSISVNNLFSSSKGFTEFKFESVDWGDIVLK